MWRYIALAVTLTTLLSTLAVPLASAEGVTATEWDRVQKLQRSEPGDWSLALGYDPMHGETGYAEVRYFGGRWKHWSAYLGSTVPTTTGSHSSLRLGAELYETWFSGRFETGLGVTLTTPDSVVATTLRYQLRAEVILNYGFSLGVVHESNCASLCRSLSLPLPRGPENKPNLGYNFVFVRWRF